VSAVGGAQDASNTITALFQQFGGRVGRARRLA